jgi:crotonobetainyl-CoA:carnitine CoA-transferase CaiB-like acyl-CoA transferase
MSVTGTSDGAPTKVGAPIADVVAGLYAAVGLVTGLFARVSGRPGRHFEAPLLESAMSALVNQAQGYLVNGVNPGRLGNDHPSITPYGPVRTADGWLMLAVGTDGQFEKLRAVISDSVVSEKRFDLNDDRVAAREELGKNLERVFSARGTGEWLIELADSGVPHAPILDLAGAFSQPQISNGDFIQLTSAPAGSLRQMATPLLVDGVRPKIRRGPQALGADGSLN